MNEVISIQTGTSLPPGQGHATVKLRGQEVKDQGHRRPKFDLEAWQTHRSRPLEASR